MLALAVMSTALVRTVDLDRLRAALRRDQAAGVLAAAAARPAPGQGRRAERRRTGDGGARHGRPRDGLGADAGDSPRSLLGLVRAVALGTAAFAALGLFVAGVLRAEATLALANLVYLLLMAGGASSCRRRRTVPPSAGGPGGCPRARSA